MSNDNNSNITLQLIDNYSSVENKLTKIDNKDLIAKLGLIFTVGGSAILSKGGVYKVIIPKGTHLAKSNGMIGAARGMAFNNSNKLVGHANLVKIPMDPVAMANLGVMLYQQYIMVQIYKKLEEISNKIDSLIENEKRKYKSKLIRIIHDVIEIVNNKDLILNNEELRTRELSKLTNIKSDIKELLIYDIDDINDVINNNNDSMIQEYLDAVNQLELPCKYLFNLMEVLNKTCEIEYIFTKDENVKDYCFDAINSFNNEIKGLSNRISDWHQDRLKANHIDIEEGKRNKVGLEKDISNIAGSVASLGMNLFNSITNNDNVEIDLTSEAINDVTIEYIKKQSNLYNNINDSIKQIDYDDMEIVIKDNEYYYLEH